MAAGTKDKKPKKKSVVMVKPKKAKKTK